MVVWPSQRLNQDAMVSGLKCALRRLTLGRRREEGGLNADVNCFGIYILGADC